jgi:hypothetical protein
VKCIFVCLCFETQHETGRDTVFALSRFKESTLQIEASSNPTHLNSSQFMKMFT